MHRTYHLRELGTLQLCALEVHFFQFGMPAKVYNMLATTMLRWILMCVHLLLLYSLPAVSSIYPHRGDANESRYSGRANEPTARECLCLHVRVSMRASDASRWYIRTKLALSANPACSHQILSWPNPTEGLTGNSRPWGSISCTKVKISMSTVYKPWLINCIQTLTGHIRTW